MPCKLVPWLLLGMTACATPAPFERNLTCLDSLPHGCLVRFRAESWQELLTQARPTLVTPGSLLLWCRESADRTLTFDLAQPFLVEAEGLRVWVILDGPEDWTRSELQGEFVSGNAVLPARRQHDGASNHAELVGSSKTWGDVYKISCTHVPGGSKGNAGTRVVLVGRKPEGGWQALWEGYESTFWSMGFYGVQECHRFRIDESPQVQPTSPAVGIRVDLERTLSPSFEIDAESNSILEIRRTGRLLGIPSLTLEWESSWNTAARAGDTWESLVRRIQFYKSDSPSSFARSLSLLREANGSPSPQALEPGRRIVLPEMILP